MGDDPKTSALNKYAQAHDCKNLFIVDAGSFVSQADKNPTWTILALSWRTSEYIIDQLKNKTSDHGQKRKSKVTTDRHRSHRILTEHGL